MTLLECHPESAVAPELRRPQLLLGKHGDKLALGAYRAAVGQSFISACSWGLAPALPGCVG